MSAETPRNRILAVLEADAQASYAEIAERAGVSKPTVRKYIDELEDNGVIVGYSADIDPKKLSGTSIALVGIEAESDQFVDVTERLRELEAVESLFSSSGDHMLMAEVRGENGVAVGDVIRREILSIDGVSAAHPCFLQERLK